MTPDNRMLLQAPGDFLEDSDGFVVRCPVSLSVSIAVGAAMSLMTADEFVRRAVVEKLMADGLAVDLSPKQSEGCH